MLTKAIAGEAVNYKVNAGKYSGIQLKKQWEKYLNSKSKKCQVEIMGQQVNQNLHSEILLSKINSQIYAQDYSQRSILILKVKLAINCCWLVGR